MWHASYSSELVQSPSSFRASALAIFDRVLAGVGDPEKQWVDRLHGGQALQIRRRLTELEAQTIGGMDDVRGLPEAMDRVRTVSEESGIPMTQLLKAEPEILDPSCPIYQPGRLKHLRPEATSAPGRISDGAA
ncbi:MAG: hypothetical protein F4107_08570 [Gemmatimonadetes bacterium]|nr:hypothetical protein [Gemmatimonadota bacterium]MYD13971.1 hypothetical protein [Gemmatimonadota bacterium]MYI65970.1 hypothetical protein [Gemmatimonadota bacterium]